MMAEYAKDAGLDGDCGVTTVHDADAAILVEQEIRAYVRSHKFPNISIPNLSARIVAALKEWQRG